MFKKIFFGLSLFIAGIFVGYVYSLVTFGQTTAEATVEAHQYYIDFISSNVRQAYDEESPEIARWAAEKYVLLLEFEENLIKDDEDYAEYVDQIRTRLNLQHKHLAVLGYVLKDNELYEKCINEQLRIGEISGSKLSRESYEQIIENHLKKYQNKSRITKPPKGSPGQSDFEHSGKTNFNQL